MTHDNLGTIFIILLSSLPANHVCQNNEEQVFPEHTHHAYYSVVEFTMQGLIMRCVQTCHLEFLKWQSSFSSTRLLFVKARERQILLAAHTKKHVLKHLQARYLYSINGNWFFLLFLFCMTCRFNPGSVFCLFSVPWPPFLLGTLFHIRFSLAFLFISYLNPISSCGPSKKML